MILPLKAVLRNSSLRIITAATVLFCAFIYCVSRYILWTIPLAARAGSFDEIMRIYEIATASGIALLAVGATGYRVYLTFPHPSTDYGKWLLHTGWKPTQPLPWGPAHATWQDGVFLAVIAMMARCLVWEFPIAPWLVVAVCFTFAAGVAVAVYPFRTAWLFPIVSFSLPPLLAFSAWGYWQGSIPLAIGLVLLSNASLTNALQHFDEWNERIDSHKIYKFVYFNVMKTGQAQNIFGRALGWPLDSLSPKQAFPDFTWFQKMLFAGWVGWAMNWGLFWTKDGFSTDNFIGVIMCVVLPTTFYVFLSRIACITRSMPLKLGDLRVGRWFDPQFDSLWINALLSLLLLSFLQVFIDMPDLKPFVGLWAIVVVAGAFLLAPSPERWYLSARLKLFQMNTKKFDRQTNPKLQ